MLEGTGKKKVSIFTFNYYGQSVFHQFLFAAKFLEDKLSLLFQSCSLLFSDDGLLIKECLGSLVCMDTLKVMKIEQNCDVLWSKYSLLV